MCALVGVLGINPLREDPVNRPIAILTPLMPPMRGGVADHSWHLAKNLAAAGHDLMVVSSRDTYTKQPFKSLAAINDWDDFGQLLIVLNEDVPPNAVLLWQYVPHMYGRGGVNKVLPKIWSAFRKEGRDQIILAHEVMAPWGRRPHHWYYAWHHRRQWKAAVREANLIPISTERWLEDMAPHNRLLREKGFTLASPSSIEPVPVSADHKRAWRAEKGLDPETKILAWFGTVSVSKQLEWVLDAWETANRVGVHTSFCVIGGTPTLPIPGQLRSRYRALGHMPAEEVSLALSAADLVGLPFVDGVAERRTTMMAALAHGLPVVGTTGSSTGSTLQAAKFMALSPATEERPFVQNIVDLLWNDKEREALAAAGAKAYAEQYSWPVTIDRLRAHMDQVGLLEA